MRTPKKPPELLQLLTDVLQNKPVLLLDSSKVQVRDLVERANNEGWNWEDCRYRASQANLAPEEFWVLVKLARRGDRVTVPLADTRGQPFSYRLPTEATRIFHLIDTGLGGVIGAAFPQVSTDDDRNRYLLTSLREEAISSSLIEGAVATREDAKEMIRSDRKPRTPGERMILNNYRTIRFLNEHRKQPLTPELLMEVQRLLTDGTLTTPDAGGRFRRADEDIVVWDDEDQQTLHTPPPADELPERVLKLCAFANAEPTLTGASAFVHPAIRAVLLHFWLAYDHPFVDGNGRTARALFYWSMLRSGYWLTEFLTISTVIAGQPKQYARAYLDTETDDNDLTYFLLYHLRVIERSVRAFQEYLDKKTAERRQRAALLQGRFNDRQQALLLLALKNPTAVFSYESHRNSHGVALATARADLLELETLGLLKGNRKGRRFEFAPVPNIEAVLKRVVASG